MHRVYKLYPISPFYSQTGREGTLSSKQVPKVLKTLLFVKNFGYFKLVLICYTLISSDYTFQQNIYSTERAIFLKLSLRMYITLLSIVLSLKMAEFHRIKVSRT